MKIDYEDAAKILEAIKCKQCPSPICLETTPCERKQAFDLGIYSLKNINRIRNERGKAIAAANRIQDRWTDVLEKLPKKEGEYLITDIQGNVKAYYFDITTVETVNGENDYKVWDWLDEYRYKRDPDEVIAWMPKPEGYKRKNTKTASRNKMKKAGAPLLAPLTKGGLR